MACFHPIHGYRAPGGEIKFARPGAYVDLPITIACGQCKGCRLERVRQWAVRCTHEAQTHTKNCFLTLTYDDDHLPVDRSLDASHWQYFAKRVRKYLKRTKPKHLQTFRFFHCGEYGDLNARPHYHACIFGQDFAEDRVYHSTAKAGETLYASPTVERLWGKGMHTIGELTFDSAAYVAGYLMKKVTGERQYDHYEYNDDDGNTFLLKPEYTTMSRRPGIGAKWIEKFMDDVYPRDEIIINGHQARPPKFYDAQLEHRDPEMLKRIKAKRLKQGEKHTDNNTRERLDVRETFATAKQKQKTRKI